MRNRKFVKPLLVVVAMVLVCIISVFATLAYMTDDTEVVKNTFTVGDITITLDEAKVNTAGQKVCADGTTVYTGAADQTIHDRVKANSYKMIANHEYIKDPTIHVQAGSEPAYVRAIVKVANASDFAAIDQLLGKLNFVYGANFALANSYADNGIYYYEIRYQNVVNAVEATDLPVFESFKTDANLDNTQLKQIGDIVIDVVAQAIQADGFENADAAFAALTGVAGEGATLATSYNLTVTNNPTTGA